MNEIVLEGQIATHQGVSRQQVKMDLDSTCIKQVGKQILSKSYHCFPDSTIIFPGFIDLHVHARQDVSGKQDYKEDFQTASAAALNGGVIAFADMPNNPVPPVDDNSYAAKDALTMSAPVPILLYAAVTKESFPLNRAVPYKCFVNEFSSSELRMALGRYQDNGVTFHCENPAYFEDHGSHEEKRPPRSEIESIREILRLTEEFCIKTKIAHLSTKQSLELCLDAKARGLPVTVEIAPHHLYFDTSMLTDENRKLLQVNPPIRTTEHREYLLRAVKEGLVDYLATDHAPHTLKDKTRGVSGMPHLDTYGLFVAWLLEQGVNLEILARMCCFNPSQFMMQYTDIKLGEINEGYSGHLVLIDRNASTIVTKEILKTKCGWSPFEGITFPGRVSVFP